jgi:hypothetical protein
VGLIREPQRRLKEPDPLGEKGQVADRPRRWLFAAPVYLVVAMASLVDNAVGAWAPSMLIRQFAMTPAEVGLELGTLLTIAFGGGVLVGGVLADRAAALGGWSAKLLVCLGAGVLIVLDAQLIGSRQAVLALGAIPTYFALSGIVTATGFSAILD